MFGEDMDKCIDCLEFSDCTVCVVRDSEWQSRNYKSPIAFYRAMHFSAKRGIAIACRLSVCNVGGL